MYNYTDGARQKGEGGCVNKQCKLNVGGGGVGVGMGGGGGSSNIETITTHVVAHIYDPAPVIKWEMAATQ